MQLPTTFRDPAQSFGAPGPTNTSTHNPGWTNIDNSGKYWVAGGGGGGAYGPDSGHTSGVGGVGSPSVGSSPFAGAGNGSRFFWRNSSTTKYWIWWRWNGKSTRRS